jgi:hypothetical protein
MDIKPLTDEEFAIAVMNMVSILHEKNMKNDNGTLEHSPVDKAQQPEMTNPTDTEAMRREFEAAHQDYILTRQGYGYLNVFTQPRWEAWQLAKQANEIARLNTENAQLREALENVLGDAPFNNDEMGGCLFCGNSNRVSSSAYVGADPADHMEDCHWIVAKEALSNTSTKWLEAHDAEVRQEQIEKDEGICDVIEMNGRGAKACSDAIRNQSEVSDPADLKRCCDVVDCTCSLDD